MAEEYFLSKLDEQEKKMRANAAKDYIEAVSSA